jgi:hypothetical protein
MYVRSGKTFQTKWSASRVARFLSMQYTKTAKHTKLLPNYRVARWFLFKPKILIWVNFGGPQIGNFLYILWPFGLFYRHLGYFMIIWYIFSGFDITYVPRKIWQPCQITKWPIKYTKWP